MVFPLSSPKHVTDHVGELLLALGRLEIVEMTAIFSRLKSLVLNRVGFELLCFVTTEHVYLPVWRLSGIFLVLRTLTARRWRARIAICRAHVPRACFGTLDFRICFCHILAHSLGRLGEHSGKSVRHLRFFGRHG